jgi:hypothetical protein
MALEIDKLSFGSKLKELELSSYTLSLSKYRKDFNSALKLEGDIVMFVDTNVLLRYYSVSFSSRKGLYEFFKENKGRIIITPQVQKEFVKNREDIINRFFNETLNKFTGGFREEIKNKIQNYIDKNTILLDDFPLFESKIKKIDVDIKIAQDQLDTEIESIKGKLNKTKYEDELLDLMQEMNLNNLLSEEDIKFLKTEFDSLRKNIDVSKIKTELVKPQAAFPGLGDIKEKPENPYGDYLLFHEMLKYVKNNSKSAVFLTYDTAKGDWLKENKEPHSHYIQIVYLSTGQIIFFVDAERFFDTHLKKHFDSLIAKREYYSPKSEYTKEFIINFIELERLIRTIAEYVVVDNAEFAPLIKIIDEFMARDYIGNDFKREFRDLNNFKNTLLHVRNTEKVDSMAGSEFLKLNQRLEAAITVMSKLYSKL